MRLAYSDWLEANGRVDIAQFVRWQIETGIEVGFVLSSIGLNYYGHLHKRNERDIAVLRSEFRSRFLPSILTELESWVRPFPRDSSRSRPNVKFRRGLPEIDAPIHHIDSISTLNKLSKRLTPHTRLVCLRLLTEEIIEPFRDLLAHPVLRRARYITASDNLEIERTTSLVMAIIESDLPDRIEALMLGRRTVRSIENACENLSSRTQLVLMPGFEFIAPGISGRGIASGQGS